MSDIQKSVRISDNNLASLVEANASIPPEMKIRLVTIIVTAICFVVNFTDGFDLVAMAAAAPLIAEEFTLSASVLGFLFSAALVGMAVGAMVLSPLSDRFGRKRIMLYSVGLIAIAMVGIGFSNSLAPLIGLRFLTGVGVGGVLGSASSLVSEFAPEKHRSLLVIISATGFTVGTVVVGPIAASIIELAGWRGIFFVGAGFGGLAFLLVLLFLPESPEYLARSGQKSTANLARVNNIRARMGAVALINLPTVSSTKDTSKPALGSLLSRSQRKKTLMLWALLFTSFWTSYFLINWTPQLFVLAGYSLKHSITALSLVTFGGLIAAWLVGFFSPRWPMAKTISLLLFGSVIVMAAYIFAMPTNLTLIMTIMFVIGFCVNGALTALYGLVAIAYPLEFRATGIGWALGVGRLGAIASPIAAGFMVTQGIGMYGLLIILAIPMALIGAVLSSRIGRQIA